MFRLNETKKIFSEKKTLILKIERKKKLFKKLLLEISQTCIFKQPSKEKKGADWCKEKKGGKRK